MRSKLFYRWLLFVSLLIAVTMGCGLINNIREGVELVGTGQAIVTDIEALTTGIIPGGIEETAQALITEIDPGSLVETAGAAITEIDPGLITTEIYTSPEEGPEDIPVMEGDLGAFVGTPQSVSYTVDAEFSAVLDFYKREMPNNGWQEDTSEGSSSDNLAELIYTKVNRKASVTITEIPFIGVTVFINIEGE